MERKKEKKEKAAELERKMRERNEGSKRGSCGLERKTEAAGGIRKRKQENKKGWRNLREKTKRKGRGKLRKRGKIVKGYEKKEG